MWASFQINIFELCDKAITSAKKISHCAINLKLVLKNRSKNAIFRHTFGPSEMGISLWQLVLLKLNSITQAYLFSEPLNVQVSTERT